MQTMQSQKYSFGTPFSIHSLLVWSKNNLDWTKTSAAFTDSDIEFFFSLLSPPWIHSESIWYVLMVE